MSSLLSGPGFFAVNQISTTEPFLRTLRAEYKTIAEMRTVRVVGITMMKQPLVNSIAAHEYLVAILEDDNGRIGYLLFERMAGDHIASSSSNEHRRRFLSCSSSSPSFSSSSSSSLIPTSLDSISGDRHARDEVTNLGGSSVKQEGDIKCATYRFGKDRHLYLYHLAIIADVVSQVLGPYRTFSNNCYSFAKTVLGVLQQEFTLTCHYHPIPLGSGVGKWVDLPTNVDDRSIVVAVAKFTEELPSFERSVEAVEAKARQQEDEIQVLKRELKEAREARA